MDEVDVEVTKITNLTSMVRIVGYRNSVFFIEKPEWLKSAKKWHFEQNMCRVFVVWGGRVLVAFYEVLVEMDDEWNKLHVFMHNLL